MTLLELFCDVDDCCQVLQAQSKATLPAHTGQRRREPGLSESEIMTLIIHFHQSGYRTFKHYYQQHVQIHLRREFPQAVSYSRFVSLMPRVLLLWAYAMYRCGHCTGISFIDSTPLSVCHNRRIPRHKVFQGIAARGKGSMGWYGFKLHLVVNE